MLWAIHETDIGDLWETYEAAKIGKDGKAEIDEAGNMLTVTKERPRLISELSPDIAKLIENATADSKGRLIPRLYSKLQASCRNCSLYITRLHRLNRDRNSRAYWVFQCLGRNCDAAVFAPGSTTTVVPMVTRL
jgi:hypothetical protein